MPKLGEICKIESGGTPSRSKMTYWDGGSIPWIKISNMNGKFLESCDEFITQEGLANSSAKLFPRGTVLISIFATIGEVSILKFPATTNQAIAGLQIIDNVVSTEYLYYFLKSIKTKIENIGRGVAQNNINLSILRNIDILIPSNDVQNKIVYNLNLVEDLIGKAKDQLTDLDSMVKSRFIEMFGNLELNNKNWEEALFKDLTIIITDGEHSTPQRAENGIYLLSARNVLNHALQLENVDYIGNEEYERIGKRIKPAIGDVLISCSGSVGRCCSIKNNIKFQMVRSVALLRFKADVNPIFAEYMITSDFIQKQINSNKTASSQANLFQGKIKMLKGVKPPIDIQDQFADFVAQVDKSKLVVQQSLNELETLKKSLMQQYFG